MEKHAPPTRESFKRKISEEPVNPTLIQSINPYEPVNPNNDVHEGEVVQVRKVISQEGQNPLYKVKKKRKITTLPVVSTENISFRQIVSVQPEFGAPYAAAKAASQIKTAYTTTTTTTTTSTTTTTTLYIQRRTSPSTTTTATNTATTFTTTLRTSPTKNIKFSRDQSTSKEMIEDQYQLSTLSSVVVTEHSKRRFELPTTTETSQTDFPEFQFMPTRNPSKMKAAATTTVPYVVQTTSNIIEVTSNRVLDNAQPFDETSSVADMTIVFMEREKNRLIEKEKTRISEEESKTNNLKTSFDEYDDVDNTSFVDDSKPALEGQSKYEQLPTPVPLVSTQNYHAIREVFNVDNFDDDDDDEETLKTSDFDPINYDVQQDLDENENGESNPEQVDEAFVHWLDVPKEGVTANRTESDLNSTRSYSDAEPRRLGLFDDRSRGQSRRRQLLKIKRQRPNGIPIEAVPTIRKPESEPLFDHQEIIIKPKTLRKDVRPSHVRLFYKKIENNDRHIFTPNENLSPILVDQLKRARQTSKIFPSQQQQQQQQQQPYQQQQQQPQNLRKVHDVAQAAEPPQYDLNQEKESLDYQTPSFKTENYLPKPDVVFHEPDVKSEVILPLPELNMNLKYQGPDLSEFPSITSSFNEQFGEKISQPSKTRSSNTYYTGNCLFF